MCDEYFYINYSKKYIISQISPRTRFLSSYSTYPSIIYYIRYLPYYRYFIIIFEANEYSIHQDTHHASHGTQPERE